MSLAAIVGWGAVSAFGEGRDAFCAGELGQPARVAVRRDDELAAAGLARPLAARARLPDAGERAEKDEHEDRATTLLGIALDGCVRDLDAGFPEWRRRRIGIALGTSSGALRTGERFLRGDDALADRIGYFAPFHRAVSRLGVDFERATLVLGACAAATLSIGIGARWLGEGACDLVLAGGFDAVSVFVAAGFEVLRATSAESPPRPFRTGRDGMALGEGAAVLALAPPSTSRARAFVAGFGASSDAVHLTAPDRSGGGLARAAEAALRDASLSGEAVDLVSAHATATPFNDAAEAQALRRVLGSTDRVVVHPFKAQIGHTLGAAGALETLASVDAMERRILPAAAGTGPLDAEAAVRLLETTSPGEPRVALKLSAAFGGANAALVVTRAETSSAPRTSARHSSSASLRDVYVSSAAAVERELDVAALARAIGWPTDRVARSDTVCRLALTAVAKLRERHGDLSGSGIVVGHAVATLETNTLFFRRMEERGVRQAEPRRFPYTSPNAVAGEVSVAFGLTGPGFAVGAGMHAALEALVVASTLVRAGDADRIVVAAVDDVGPATRRACAHRAYAGIELRPGAAALLVSAHPEGAVARVGRTELGAGANLPPSPCVAGHLALRRLVSVPLPAALECASRMPQPGRPSWGAYARVELAAL